MYLCGATKSVMDARLTHHRRATVHQINLHPYSQQTSSTPSLQPQTSYSPTLTSRSEPARSPVNLYSRPQSTAITNAPVRPSAPPQLKPKPNAVKKKLPNLDYLSFGNEPETTTTPPNVRNTQPVKTEPGPTDWEKLLGSLDNGDMNIHDSVYGGAPLEALIDTPNLNSASTPALVGGETPIAWSQDLWALCQTDTNTTSTSSNPGLTPVNNAPASILSFSSADDGLSGSEDFGTGNSPNDDWTLTSGETFRGFVVPADDAFGSTEWISL